METLPNEIVSIILTHLPANKIVQICLCSKIFSSVCDWNFWRKKAQHDFKISYSYFDFPLTTSEGPGSFDEIPFIINCDAFIRPILLFSNRDGVFDKGVFRYYQISSRIKLQLETIMSNTKKFHQSFIEVPSFLLKAQKMSQSSIIPSLFDQISHFELWSYFDHINSFTQMFQGDEGMRKFINGIKNNHLEQGFIFSVLKRLLSSGMFEEFKTNYNNLQSTAHPSDVTKFILEIEEGIVSQELTNSLSEAYSSGNHKYVFFIFHLLYSKKNIDKNLLVKQVDFLINNGNVNYRTHLISKSLEVGNEELMEIIYQQKENLPNLPQQIPVGGSGPSCTQYVYIGGNLRIVQRLKKEHQIEDYVGELASGYLNNNRPEDYFCLFQQVKEFQSRFLRQVFETKDCDILSLCLLAHIKKHSEKHPLKVAVDLFTKYLRFSLGHLDVMAWALRVLKAHSTEMNKGEFSKIISPLAKDNIFQFDDLSREDLSGQTIKKLSEKLTLSKVMFQDGIRSMIEN